MIRFWLVSKPMPGDTVENFDYNWGIVHVALMLTTRTVMDNFRRYVQHRVPPVLDAAPSMYPRSDKSWYSCSDHVVDGIDNITYIFEEGEYTRRMHPHKFGASEFVIELTDAGVIKFERPPVATGSTEVKLLNFVMASDGVNQTDFENWWHQKHAAKIVSNAETVGLVRRYVQSTQLPLDAQIFRGTLFEFGGVQTYAGIEEFYFDSVEDYIKFSQENQANNFDHDSDLIDHARSFSMPTVERVVFDFVDCSSPSPAVLDPSSLEHGITANEPDIGQWNMINQAAASAAT